MCPKRTHFETSKSGSTRSRFRKSKSEPTRFRFRWLEIWVYTIQISRLRKIAYTTIFRRWNLSYMGKFREFEEFRVHSNSIRVNLNFRVRNMSYTGTFRGSFSRDKRIKSAFVKAKSRTRAKCVLHGYISASKYVLHGCISDSKIWNRASNFWIRRIHFCEFCEIQSLNPIILKYWWIEAELKQQWCSISSTLLNFRNSEF